jgi:hypothetical protein
MAYAAPTGVYRDGSTLYIAGTRNLDDVSSWPSVFLGGLDRSTRWNQAYPEFLASPTDTIVGHSLGAAVASKLLETPNSDAVARLYGAPRWSFNNSNPRIESWSHPGDPVSVLDFGAHHRLGGAINPHSYSGFTP